MTFEEMVHAGFAIQIGLNFVSIALSACALWFFMEDRTDGRMHASVHRASSRWAPPSSAAAAGNAAAPLTASTLARARSAERLAPSPSSAARAAPRRALDETMVVTPRHARGVVARDPSSEPPVSSAPMPGLPAAVVSDEDADPTCFLKRGDLRAGPDIEIRVLETAEPRGAS